jgi:hypothetical protein
VAWRRRDQKLGPVPAWVETYTEADWVDDEADAKWLGSAPSDYVPAILEWHRRSRWVRARNEWLDRHPAHAKAELWELIELCGGDPARFGL